MLQPVPISAISHSERSQCALIFSLFDEHSRGNFYAALPFIACAMRAVGYEYCFDRAREYEIARRGANRLHTLPVVRFFREGWHLSPLSSYSDPPTPVRKSSSGIVYDPPPVLPASFDIVGETKIAHDRFVMLSTEKIENEISMLSDDPSIDVSVKEFLLNKLNDRLNNLRKVEAFRRELGLTELSREENLQYKGEI